MHLDRGRSRGRGGGEGRRQGGLITNLRTRYLRFTSHETTFSRFLKIEIVQNVKNVTLVPFCKTESGIRSEALVVTLFLLLFTKDRQKAVKVKCKREESLTKQSIFVEYSVLALEAFEI